tara:strand:+ start:598 stop:948 length:351 start_codon:yes stop_codon:yes gene_type:complete
MRVRLALKIGTRLRDEDIVPVLNRQAQLGQHVFKYMISLNTQAQFRNLQFYVAIAQVITGFCKQQPIVTTRDGDWLDSTFNEYVATAPATQELSHLQGGPTRQKDSHFLTFWRECS